MKKNQLKTITTLLTLFAICGVILLPISTIKASSTDFSTLNSNNSQTTGALDPSTISIASISAPDNKNSKEIDTTVDNSCVNIVASGTLEVSTGPLGVCSEDADINDQMSTYVVNKGDTIEAVAKMFGVSTKTIIWANDLPKDGTLTPGDVELILPVSGVTHVVVKGDTLKSLAAKYEVDIRDISTFNGISEDAGLTIGDELIIPDGTIAPVVDTVSKKPSNTNKNPSKNYGSKKEKYYKTHHLRKVPAGYFINPVPGASRQSQGFHDRNAIDLAAPTGTPIYAATSGTVIKASAGGWGGGYGSYVLVQDAGGTHEMYAHMSKVIAHTGDHVSKGEIIGRVGSTGHSTGPHLHFELSDIENPFVVGTLSL